MLYFKHLSNMRHDPKIKRLISRFGIEGYGWYCLILESISENITTQNPIPELEETSADLADFYNGNSARIDEIVGFMVTTGLLEYDKISNQIACHKIYKLLEANQTRSEAIRQLISSYKTTKGILIDTSQTVSDKSERKEKKRKEKTRTIGDSDESPSVRNPSFIKPSVSEVSEYCKERRNGIDPLHFIDHYEANGWMVGKNKMKDWKAAIRTWERTSITFAQKTNGHKPRDNSVRRPADE